MPEFTDVMVDLETTGLAPDFNAVIQISAVKFNLDTHAVDTNFFNQCLSIPPTRWWDEGTRQWWGKQPDVLRGIYARMRSPATVMAEFYEWARDQELRFWAKPLSFDFPFVQSYFREFGPAMPFDFRKGRDLRTFMAGIAYPFAPFPEASIPFEGSVHDAIFDTLHQLKILYAAMDARNEPGVLDQR
ncbi:MAG TPA: 3'-5' exonuclease [Rhodopila sp.]|nr:3'-5' exonuclease [Rhodopila sp.]